MFGDEGAERFVLQGRRRIDRHGADRVDPRAPEPSAMRRASPSPSLRCATPCISATACRAARWRDDSDGGNRSVTADAASVFASVWFGASRSPDPPPPQHDVPRAQHEQAPPLFPLRPVDPFAARFAARSSLRRFAASEGIVRASRGERAVGSDDDVHETPNTTHIVEVW